MMLGAIAIVEWLAARLHTSTDNVDLGLWIALMAGLLFATVQFITMMVTRWGDSDPTRKAFMFSVLIHLSMAFGAVVVTPPAAVLKKSEEIKEEVKVREVFIEGEEKVELSQTGNTRIWEQLPDSPSQQLSRAERVPQEFTPLEGPERTPEPLTTPDMPTPNLRPTPDMPVARPEPQNFGDTGPKIESAAPLQITDTNAEARPEVNVPSMSPVRRRVIDSGLQEFQVERTPTRGAVDRVAPVFETRQQLTAIEAPTDATAFLKRAELAESSISRRSGPSPAELEADEAGTVAEDQTAGAQTGSVGPQRFTRLRNRTPKMEALGGVERFEPDRTPQSPAPIPGPALAVRDTPPTVFPVDGVQPSVVRPNFDPINTSAATKIPPTYRLRSLANRQDSARRFGGTDASEQAVEASLRWLALHQSPEGFWDADGFWEMCPAGEICTGRSGLVGIDEEGVDRQNAGREADAGVTGLTILAFLGAGYTHEEGQYADQVDRALSWLVRQQEADGFLGGKATRYARMYCHAIATYSMAEALGMQTDRTNDSRLRAPLEKAVGYIVENQNPDDGGWRYLKGQKGDMSMFGWQLMALKSAEIAGITVPEQTKQLMIQFLRDRSIGPNNGLASYRVIEAPFEPLPPTPSMTAEALFCKQMLGLSRANPQSQEAVGYLMGRIPNRSSEDIYYWYYGTLAMYQYGGDEWRTWNNSLRDYLVSDQRTVGHAAGSWDPKPPWGPYGGRVFSTALSTLCLEVYYRFLPLYRVGDDPGLE